VNQNRMVNRLVPGGSLLQDHNTFDPVVPHDIAKREAANADGTAKCEMCRETLPLANLDITAYGYRCAPCQKKDAELKNPAPANLDNVKVGRGRWWIMPIVIAVGSVITILEPAFVIILVGLVALFGVRLFVRRGL
jgi:hypothetical protein